jgi:hypothetical protein
VTKKRYIIASIPNVPEAPETIEGGPSVTVATKCSTIVVLAVGLCAAGSALAAKERQTSLGVWDIGFSVTGGFIDQSYCPGEEAKIRMPAYIESERYNSPMASYFTPLKTDYLTDNPLLHGAIYSVARMKARSAGLGVFCDLIMEHRGTSFGTYAMKDVAVVPRFFVSVDTAFAIGGQTFGAGVEAGNYEDRKLYEGLTVYNMDVQGYHLHLKWRNLKASVDHISDLSAGIGLNIDDEADYTLSVEDLPLGERLKLDLSAGYVEYLGSRDTLNGLPEDGINVSAALGWAGKIRCYAQIGVRDVGDAPFGGSKRCADLAGLSYRDTPVRGLDLDLTGEYRFYGRYFNEGRSNDGSCFLYRGYDGYNQQCSSWNTVGAQLYPLHAFWRPFSQWAVYTDYEGRDVQSLIFRADASYGLPKGCSLVCNLDFNYLDVSNEEAFLYPFYNLGAGWSPARGTTITISYTNRAMNLDTHYPTLYLTEEGTLMIAVLSSIAF